MLDMSLSLIEQLLKEKDPNVKLIKSLLEEVMMSLNEGEAFLKVEQQSLWLNILKQIKYRNPKTEDIACKWCGFDYLYPQHHKSFEPDSPGYDEQRSKEFAKITRAIWTRIDGSDTGPSLIGIQSDMWKMGLFEDE